MAVADLVHEEDKSSPDSSLMTPSQLFTICQILLAIFYPPVAVFLERGLGVDLVLNVCLTCLLWLPGSLHALYIVLKYESRIDPLTRWTATSPPKLSDAFLTESPTDLRPPHSRFRNPLPTPYSDNQKYAPVPVPRTTKSQRARQPPPPLPPSDSEEDSEEEAPYTLPPRIVIPPPRLTTNFPRAPATGVASDSEGLTTDSDEEKNVGIGGGGQRGRGNSGVGLSGRA